jgi:hypothetical protein
LTTRLSLALALADHKGGGRTRRDHTQRFVNIPAKVDTSAHEAIVTFIERSRAETDELIAGNPRFGGFNFLGPDNKLIELAAAGKLDQPKVMEQQVRRMLADPSAATLVGSFALEWLNLDELAQVDPDPRT